MNHPRFSARSSQNNFPVSFSGVQGAGRSQSRLGPDSPPSLLAIRRYTEPFVIIKPVKFDSHSSRFLQMNPKPSC
ncbi:hypothetical protein EVAR_12165_1 [Eumeta japonica]|uniref:Uncharacterized protein n=1 Tax=Eumeta variegata TaxID=151549 RepID=A0A4C1UHW4_EUMVA|nr:hypothetical protein EVAR_12165_1 [Eumeta japonica]